MLRTDGLRLAYPGQILVDGLSIEFQPGQVWAVLGRNGSGKSTLLHALAALRPPEAGNVTLRDAMIGAMPRRALARQIGVLLQEESREFWGSVRDYVLLGRYPHARSPFGWSVEDEHVAESEIEAMHLGGLGNRPFAALSGGERQRISIARAILHDPKILIFDEATSSLDPPTAEQVGRTISALKGKVSILFIAHQVPKSLQIDHVVRIGEKLSVVSGTAVGERPDQGVPA
jgi:iron complex transport system ATP-binding protein